jgi:hypothetical protein
MAKGNGHNDPNLSHSMRRYLANFFIMFTPNLNSLNVFILGGLVR